LCLSLLDAFWFDDNQVKGVDVALFPTYYSIMGPMTTPRQRLRQILPLGIFLAGITAIGLGLGLGLATSVMAEERVVQGEFFFGPDMGEGPACAAAEQRAKQEALRQVLGERFSVSEQLSCREGRAGADAGTDNTDCVYNRLLWSEIDGDIKRAERLGRPEVVVVPGATRCTVRMRVVVDLPAQQPDPGFDFEASLSSISLRAKESVRFAVRPSAPMHMAIFSWAPAHDKTSVTRIFPNSFDTNALLRPAQENRIPSELGAQRYGFTVSFPAGLKQDFVDEYLIFVATKAPVAWLERYEFERFKARLREIAPPEKRVVKHSYRIVN